MVTSSDSDKEKVNNDDDDELLTKTYNIQKKKSYTKTSQFNSVELIPKFEFECLMQGYRVDPKDNDDNSIPDNCEVSFESIIHTNNIVQLGWKSHTPELISLERYHSHLSRQKLWLPGTTILQDAMENDSAQKSKEVNNLSSNSTNLIEAETLIIQNDPPYINSRLINLGNLDEDHSNNELPTLVENATVLSVIDSSLNEKHHVSYEDGLSSDISFPYYDSKAPYQRSEQNKIETHDMYTKLQSLYQNRNVDTKLSLFICGQNKTFATFRFPATNGVLDITSKKNMFFVDADNLNDPLYVTYKYQCCIATATTKRGSLGADGKYIYHGIVHLSLCALGHHEYPTGRFVLLQVIKRVIFTTHYP